MSVSLRMANPTDAGATGAILWQFIADTEWMPKLYTAAETVSFCGTMIDRGWVTVAESGGRVLGFLARDGQEICALYLASDAQGQGMGRMLLESCKAETASLHLRTFANNQRARRFYEMAGFRETSRGDGRDNDENLPDVHYVWTKESGK